MLNRNGSNNGNGVHKDTAVAVRNGNGHKPDAVIPAEHELLWDGLSPAVSQALGQPIDPEVVSQRKGRGGKTFDYLEGHVVIDQANRIFGYGDGDTSWLATSPCAGSRPSTPRRAR